MKRRSSWIATLSMWGRASATFGRIGHRLEHGVGQTDDAGALVAAYDGLVEGHDAIADTLRRSLARRDIS